jgi:hypothetical protein
VSEEHAAADAGERKGCSLWKLTVSALRQLRVVVVGKGLRPGARVERAAGLSECEAPRRREMTPPPPPLPPKQRGGFATSATHS